MSKTRQVLVKCLIVTSDGDPAGYDGEAHSKGAPFYDWLPRRRSNEWLANPKNRKFWKERK